MVSGHVLAKKGQKISKKTGGGQYRPEQLIEQNSADALRYAMTGASLGLDAYFEEAELLQAKRLIMKIYHAGKFTIANLGAGYRPPHLQFSRLEAFDQWILHRTRQTAQAMARYLDKSRYHRARTVFERFFWHDFCDNYLEISKERAYGPAGRPKESARFTLYHAYLAILKLIAPFLPHISEEMYHSQISRQQEAQLVSGSRRGLFAKNESLPSIHLSNWPNLTGRLNSRQQQAAAAGLKIIEAARAAKSARKLSLGSAIGQLVVECPLPTWRQLQPFLGDLRAVTKSKQILHKKASRFGLRFYF